MRKLLYIIELNYDISLILLSSKIKSLFSNQKNTNL